MRLIDVYTLQLREFADTEIPPYAILSHTWDTGEVTINDLRTSYAENLTGFQKIRYLCDQARYEGLRFAWCDTCCIDKSSSAELSESINSMFKWYQGASVCYAYLVDVSTSTPGQFEEEFATSRWFQRGWTLQELIAPERVTFYGQGWIPLGRKVDLHNIISDITRIPIAVLLWPWTIQSYSIARRMSWASDRTTTRVEDAAYSLMGIFGVHMPLVYGEGRSAFRRFQEELIKGSDDESVFVHSGPNILADCAADFEHSDRIVPLEHREFSQTFSMTNRGVQIELRLVHGRDDQSDYNNYFAIPLQPTALPNTFIKASGSPLPVNEGEALRAKPRRIYIGLNQLPPFTISCILQCHFIQAYGYTVNPCIEDMPCTWYEAEHVMTLHLNPKSVSHWACMGFSFENSKDEQAFQSIVFFDFSRDKIGVLIHQRSAPLDHLDDRYEMWKHNGNSEACSIELDIEADGHIHKVKLVAAIRREIRLQEPLLVLDISLHEPEEQ